MAAVTRRGEMDEEWAGKSRRFRLTIGDLERLEAMADVGAIQLHRRLMEGVARIGEVRSVIHCALRGGGLCESEAKDLAGSISADNFYMATVIATAAMGVAFLPEDDDAPKKTDADQKTGCRSEACSAGAGDSG